MESAHVLIRLRDSDADSPSGSRDTADGRSPPRSDVGVRRISATSVRLEHSDMSPGVASISFEQVFDEGDTNAQMFETSLASAVGDAVVGGHALTVVATGAKNAGKSFCMHGDRGNNSKTKGLVELAIERAFAIVAQFHEWQVLLSVGCTQERKNKDQRSDVLIDEFTGEPFSDDVAGGRDQAFLSRAVRVENVSEAVQAYKAAFERCCQPDQSTDCVCVVFVESRAKSGSIHRSRLGFIDIHDNHIIEPSQLPNQDNAPQPKLFAETYFPVHETLTKWCGGFLGNESTTFVVVAIETSAKRQQQAIQSLLFACKAKEIKSTVQICQLELFSVAPAYADVEGSTREPEDQDALLTCLGSPVSSVSSVSKESRRPQSASDVLAERLRQAYQSVKSSVPKTPPRAKSTQDSEVQPSSGLTMQNLHAKADAILSSSVSNKIDVMTMTLLEKLDAIGIMCGKMDMSLQHEKSVKEKCAERIAKLNKTMSFQVVEHEKQLKARDAENQALRAQLEAMQSKYDDAEHTLEALQAQVEAMKVATRERAGARSPGKATNERMLLLQFSARLETAMLEAKAVVDHKDAVIRDLEARVQQLQAANDTLEKSISSANVRSREEKDRWVAKQTQWETEKAQWVDEAAEWEREKTRWETDESKWKQEKACLVKEKAAWEAEKERWQTEVVNDQKKSEDLAEMQTRLERAEARWSQEKAEWNRAQAALMTSIASYQGDLEEAKAKTKDLVDQLALSDQDWSAKVTELENVIEIQRHDLTRQLRDEISIREARIAELELALKAQESIVACGRDALEQLKAAATAGERQMTELRAALDGERTTFAKEKKKLEKKLRLLTNERKQQLDDAEKAETEMALEVKRLGLELESLRSDCQIKDTELERARSLARVLQEQIETLETQRSVANDQISVLQDCNNKLEIDKQSIQEKLEQLEREEQALREELEHRTYALEQRAARQLIEKEAKLVAQTEARVRDLMDRHSSELLQRDLELRRLRNRRVPQPLHVSSSSSSSSSSPSHSSPHNQHDIEQLDSTMDTSGSSFRPNPRDKRLEDKLAKQKAKTKALQKQVDSLTHALAVANEQESLAKEAIEQQRALYERMMYAQEELQTQVNVLREENWSLSLALHVAEKRGPSEDGTFLPLSSRVAEC